MASAAQITQAPIALAAVSGACDLSKRTYFTATVAANTAFTFTNVPLDVMTFDVEISHSAGSISWPANVRWAGGISPSGYTAGKIHLFNFRRAQTVTGSVQWIGMFQINC